MKEAILADTPLENPEQDRLGFAPFAKNLADAICKVSTDDCLVFALYGQWGTGKTTCLNFVLHYINEKTENERPIIIRFNPWWFSGHGELLNQFFREFCIALGKDEKYKETIELINDLLDIASEIPSIGIFGKIGKILTRKLRNYTKEKEVWRLRKEIHHNLLKQDKHILVIIDDIDRLPSDEIKSLFRVIKAVADFPKTTYLLAFDKNVVTEALKNFQEINGEAYLEKIVQVPFNLPLPDKVALRILFFKQTNVIFTDAPKELLDVNYWWNVYWRGIDHFLNTMRNVKRLINGLNATYPIVKGEVNPVDFVAIETVRVFYSNIYNLIRDNPNLFTRNPEMIFFKIEDIKPFHDKWLEQISEADKDAIKKLLSNIFPILKAVFSEIPIPDSGWKSVWRRNLRICSFENFPIYFRLSVPEDELTYSEIQAILALTSNSEIFGNKLLELSRQHRLDGSTRVSAFLERLADYSESDTTKENISQILEGIFNVGDSLLLPEDERHGFLSRDNARRMERIMLLLLEKFETQEERFKLLEGIFPRGKSLSMIVWIVGTLGQQHGKYDSRIQAEEEQLFSIEYIEKLEKIVLSRIEVAAENGELLKVPNIAHIFYLWRIWGGEESVKGWVSRIISSDKGLVNFLAWFVSKAYIDREDNILPIVEERFNIDSIPPFINLDEVAGRCQNILKSPPDWLEDKNKKIIELFLTDYNLRIKNQNSHKRRD